MVFHDSDFKRMGIGSGMGIWELHDAELATIDIGSWKSPAFASSGLPRFPTCSPFARTALAC